MFDQFNKMEKLNLHQNVTCLYGDNTDRELESREFQVNLATKSLLYITPETFVKQQEFFLNAIRKFNIERIVLDEVQCVHEWG